MIDRSEQRLKTLLPASSLGLLTAAFIIAKTGRDALFFQGTSGLLQLPLIYINIAAASLPLAIIFVQAMKLWGARRARIGLLLLAAAAMAGAAPWLQPGSRPLTLAVFMLIPAAFGPLFASLWLLAADIFETTDRRAAARAFSNMGASSLAGGMLGGLISKALAPHLDPKWLVFAGAALVVGVIALVVRTHRRFPPSASRKGPVDSKSGFLGPLRSKYSLTLLLISMTGALAGLLIDFQFYAAAAAAALGPRGNTGFFANFYIMLNLGSLLLQLFATPKIQDRIGLRGGLMVLPLALIGGATFVTAAATAISRSVLKVTEGGIRSSIHRSIWEQAFLPVDSAERSAVKLAVDGVGARVAEAGGALIILVWLKQAVPDGVLTMPLDTRWMSWLTLATVAVWLAVTRALRAEFKPAGAVDVDCERFPEQCPCTTELGKGIR
ncbi:MAG TPA: Npt1/Npt2 family nucleotide transporter [candidate division Zixibacteria bacterium]|nr:Npt1/Npt2 family nucleotide transporter [candidate division Zixibacteria bacterium]